MARTKGSKNKATLAREVQDQVDIQDRFPIFPPAALDSMSDGLRQFLYDANLISIVVSSMTVKSAYFSLKILQQLA